MKDGVQVFSGTVLIFDLWAEIVKCNACEWLLAFSFIENHL